ncbi:tetratricopeptide repeat protein [candidate division KSB1 bacterium]|nr:tetratricopeptide repeat protein [candidate division KSB1 bacterium]
MRKVHSILLVSVLLVAMLTLFGCQSKELTSAKVYIQQDDWEKAQEQLELAVELYPNDAEAHALLGEAYGRNGEFEKMAKEFEASLAINQNSAQQINYLRDKYWVENFNKGVGQVKAENFAQALSFFRNCPIIDPDRTDSYKNIAFVYMRLDSMDQAIASYQKVLEYDPKETQVMLQLGSLYYDLEQYEKTVELMDRILEIEPNNLEAFSQKAFAFDSMGKPDDAFQAYNEALAQNPDNTDLIFNLGRLYYMKKNYREAIDQFMKVLEKSPDDIEATLNIGNAYLSIAEEYMEPLRAGEEMSDEEFAAKREKAIENYKEAIPYLEKAIEEKADDPALWTNLGVAYINAGEKEKGEAAFQKADEL